MPQPNLENLVQPLIIHAHIYTYTRPIPDSDRYYSINVSFQSFNFGIISASYSSYFPLSKSSYSLIVKRDG